MGRRANAVRAERWAAERLGCCGGGAYAGGHGDRRAQVGAAREAVPDDEPALRRILATPEVARWWGEVDDLDGMLAVTVDGRVIGAIQYDEEDDPQYRSAGIDIFLDPEHHGQGYGAGGGADAGDVADRRERPSPAHHRPRRAQHGGHQGLREGGLQARGA
ncbi:hypothetical protein GCM10020219_088020 [Nonomuraea dietziae]